MDELVRELTSRRAEVRALVARIPPEALGREVSHAARRVVVRDLLASLSAHDLEHAAELRA